MKVQFYYLSGGRSLLHNSLLIYFTPLLVTSTCFPLFLTKPTFSGCAGITAFLPFAFLITFILHTFQLFLICCPLAPFHLPPAKAAKITWARPGAANQTVVMHEPCVPERLQKEQAWGT